MCSNPHAVPGETLRRLQCLIPLGCRLAHLHWMDREITSFGKRWFWSPGRSENWEPSQTSSRDSVFWLPKKQQLKMTGNSILIFFLATAEDRLEVSSDGCPLNGFLETHSSAEERPLLPKQTKLPHWDFPSPGLQWRACSTTSQSAQSVAQC